MMNKLIIKDFFKNKKNWKKSYLINVNDEVIIDNKSYEIDVYFNLIFEKKGKDLIVTVQLYSYSNDEQKHVFLEKIDFYKKYLYSIKKYYYLIIEKFLRDLNNYLKNENYLKEFIHTIENPSIKYHYKLLNTFTKEELDKIRSIYRNIPRLRIYEFYHDKIDFPNIFEADYIDGFYGAPVEIRVDLDDSDYAGIYELSDDYSKWKKIAKEKALEVLLNNKGKI
jgi:transcription termination factor NusB